MTVRKFLTSVANAYGYDDSTGALLFIGKTLLDSSIDTTLANTDVRGGRGAQLQYVFYHTAAMNITITDAQWNLDFLSKIVGNDIATGTNIFTEETIVLGASGGGTILGTPLAVTGATIYGWVTQIDGTVDKVTFSGSTFPSSTGTISDSVCVRYYALDNAARSITINANILPSIVHIVLEAQLNSSDSTTNQIGVVQIDIPKATLTGAFKIDMKMDGVSSTPLAARALANVDTTSAACSDVPFYATIKEIISAANWYDNVIAIGIEGGDLAINTANSPITLHVWAVPSSGLPFLAPVTGTEMTFASSDTGKATVGANSGVVTKVATGTSVIHAYITSKATIDAYITATVT